MRHQWMWQISNLRHRANRLCSFCPRVFFASVCTFVLLFQSSTLQAGASEGLVATPLVHEGNVFMFSAGTHHNKPACAVAGLGTWAISLSTETGRNMMSLVLGAHAQGKRVHVQGTNNCADWGDREKPLYLFIVD